MEGEEESKKEKVDRVDKISTVRKLEKRPVKKKAKSKNSLLLGNETGSKRKNATTKTVQTANHGFYTEADDKEVHELTENKLKEVADSVKYGKRNKKKTKIIDKIEDKTIASLSTATHKAMDSIKKDGELNEDIIIQANLKLYETVIEEEGEEPEEDGIKEGRRRRKRKKKRKISKADLAKYLEEDIENNSKESMPKESIPGSTYDSMVRKMTNAGISSEKMVEDKLVEKLSTLGATEMAVIESKVNKNLYSEQQKRGGSSASGGRSFMNKYPWEYSQAPLKKRIIKTTEPKDYEKGKEIVKDSDDEEEEGVVLDEEEREQWDYQESLFELSTREEFAAWSKSSVPEEIGIFVNYVLGIPGMERLIKIRKEIMEKCQKRDLEEKGAKESRDSVLSSHIVTIQELIMGTGIFGEEGGEEKCREMILEKLGKWTYLVATTVLAESEREDMFKSFIENYRFGEVEWILSEDLGREVDLDYVRRFLREAVGDERQCCRGEQCISLQLPKFKDFPNTKEEVDVSLETIVEEVSIRYPGAISATPAMFYIRGRNEGFVMREYLTPTQWEKWREKSILPKRAGCCFMCLTSLQTFYTYKAQELKVDPPFQCYFYRVKIEEGKGFSKSQLLHTESAGPMAMINTLQFDKNDYKLTKTRITVGSDNMEVKCWEFQIRDF